MALALVGPQSLEELHQLAIEQFGGISNPTEDETPPLLPSSDCVSSDSAFPFTNTSKIIRIRPLKEIRDVSLMIPLPPSRSMYRANPSRLLGHLVSYKGEKSLFSLLQSKGWINSLSAGTRTSFEDFSLFEVSMSLTVEGLEHWEEVVSCVYNHLRMLKSLSDAELQRIWSEIKTISSLEFQHQDKISAYELAPELAGNMLTYKMEHIFSVGSLLDEYPSELFCSFLDKVINPLNAVITLRSPTFDWIPADLTFEQEAFSLTDSVNRLERWYGVPYSETPITSQQLKLWNGGSDMNDSGDMKTRGPIANPFIPYELIEVNEESSPRLRSLRSLPPVKVQSRLEGEEEDAIEREAVWASRDEAFGLPKSAISVLLESPHCVGGHPVLGLIGSIFSQTFTEKYYPSAFAGLQFSLGIGNRGILMSFSGFSPKLCTFAEDVAAQFCSKSFWGNVSPVIFESSKDGLLRRLQGWTKERPDSSCDMLLRYILQEAAWLPADRLKAAEAISLDDVERIVTEALQRSRVITYVHGDLSASEVLPLHRTLADSLSKDQPLLELRAFHESHGYGLKPFTTRARILGKPTHRRVLVNGFNPQDENNALVCYFEAKQKSARSTAHLLVLQKLLAEPCFNELRTKKQLGYIVSLGLTSFGSGLKRTMRGIAIRVLSNRYSPWAIENEVGSFLSSQKHILEQISQTDVDVHVSSLVRALEDPPSSYLDEAGLFWDCILDDEDAMFDWREQVIASLRAATAEDVRALARECLFDPLARRTLSIMSFGKNHLSCRETPDTELKDGASTFPFRGGDRLGYSIDELTSLRDSLAFL